MDLTSMLKLFRSYSPIKIHPLSKVLIREAESPYLANLDSVIPFDKTKPKS
jgi:hypothetical protein